MLGEVWPAARALLSHCVTSFPQRQVFQQRGGVRELPEGRPGQSQAGERGEEAAEGAEGGGGPGAHRPAEEADGEQPGAGGGGGGEQRQRPAEPEEEQAAEERPDQDAP